MRLALAPRRSDFGMRSRNSAVFARRWPEAFTNVPEAGVVIGTNCAIVGVALAPTGTATTRMPGMALKVPETVPPEAWMTAG